MMAGCWVSLRPDLAPVRPRQCNTVVSFPTASANACACIIMHVHGTRVVRETSARPVEGHCIAPGSQREPAQLIRLTQASVNTSGPDLLGPPPEALSTRWRRLRRCLLEVLACRDCDCTIPAASASTVHPRCLACPCACDRKAAAPIALLLTCCMRIAVKAVNRHTSRHVGSTWQCASSGLHGGHSSGAI